MRVQQLNKGAFIKTLTPVESKLLERVKEGEKQFLEFSYKLQGQQKKLAASLSELTGTVSSLSALIQDLVEQVQSLERKVMELQPASSPLAPQDVYTRAEIDGMLAAYYVEEIAMPYGPPENNLFDSVPHDQKLTGYQHFPWARLKKWPDVTFGPGIMRRYTISVYASATKELTFPILHEDYLVVYLNGNMVARLSGNNLSGPADEVRVVLQPGWNRLQFLMSNREYGYSFDIGLDLAKEVDAVACLASTVYTVSGDSILPGSITPERVDHSGSFSMHSLKLTDTSSPALVCGDATKGSITIGGAQLVYDGQKITVGTGLKIEGPLEYRELQGVERPGTSFLWLGRDIYLPPAQLTGDILACLGEAVLVPASATANVIGCPGEEIICPGPYRLYLRLRPAAATTGTVATLNIKSGSKLVTAMTVQGAGLDPLRYSTVETVFEYDGGGLEFELYAGGTVDFYLDTIHMRFGS
jgi:hypothetical protein